MPTATETHTQPPPSPTVYIPNTPSAPPSSTPTPPTLAPTAEPIPPTPIPAYVREVIPGNNHTILVDINQVIKELPFNPIGIGLNHFLDSDGEHPGRTYTLLQSLQNLGVRALRINEGETGDQYQWTSAPFPLTPGAELYPRRTFYGPDLPTLNDPRRYNPDGSLVADLDFNEYMQVSYALNATDFAIIGIDALNYAPSIAGYTTSFEEIKQAAVAWVTYARLNNFRLEYWEIGNESDLKGVGQGPWQAEQYAAVVKELAIAMKQVDPSIKIGANGGMGDQAANDYWWQTVLATAGPYIDFLVVHQYQDEEDNIVQNTRSRLLNLLSLPDRARLRIHVTEMSALRPGNKNNPNTLEMALRNFVKFGKVISYPEVDYTLFWVTRWESGPEQAATSAIDWNGSLLPMGQSIQIWATTLLDQIVSTSADTQLVQPFASFSPAQNMLNVYLVNPLEHPAYVNVLVSGYTGATGNEKWEFSGATGLADLAPTWSQKDSVAFDGRSFRLMLPPASLTLVKFTNRDSAPQPTPGEFPVPQPLPAAPGVLPVISLAASSTYTGRYVENIIDGQSETGWSATSSAQPQWLALNLGAPRNVRGLRLAWFDPTQSIYQYTVEICQQQNQGCTTVLANQSSDANDWIEHLFPPISGQYVRLTITGSTYRWDGLNEVVIYGD